MKQLGAAVIVLALGIGFSASLLGRGTCGKIVLLNSVHCWAGIDHCVKQAIYIKCVCVAVSVSGYLSPIAL